MHRGTVRRNACCIQKSGVLNCRYTGCNSTIVHKPPTFNWEAAMFPVGRHEHLHSIDLLGDNQLWQEDVNIHNAKNDLCQQTAAVESSPLCWRLFHIMQHDTCLRLMKDCMKGT